MNRVRSLRCLGVVLAIGVTATPVTSRADTVIAEQVVARVDGRPILLSEIRSRARPFLKRAAASGPVALVTETQKIYVEALEQRIEEEVVASVASSLRVTVTSSEIDDAIASVAAQAHLSRDALLGAASEQGLSERAYRLEVGRAVLRYRVLQTLGLRDKTVGAYPTDELGKKDWMERVERGPFATEKGRVCVERWVRW